MVLSKIAVLSPPTHKNPWLRLALDDKHVYCPLRCGLMTTVFPERLMSLPLNEGRLEPLDAVQHFHSIGGIDFMPLSPPCCPQKSISQAWGDQKSFSAPEVLPMPLFLLDRVNASGRPPSQAFTRVIFGLMYCSPPVRSLEVRTRSRQVLLL